MNLIRKIKSFFRILNESGVSGTIKIIRKKLARKAGAAVTKKMSDAWATRKDFFISPLAFGMTKRKYKAQKKSKFSRDVRFSIIVPLYDTPEDFLREMIASVLFQTYQNWELCLADGSDSEHSYVQKLCEEIAAADKRIKYKKLKENLGISGNTNKCLELATGDYISLFDHDDLLHPAALYETAKTICNDGAELIYTDEAIFQSPDLHSIIGVHLKKDFSQELLETNNYICHFTSFKKSLLDGFYFDSECDGAQDFDIILKLTERTQKIVHIRKCLYYWRAFPSSTASGSSAKSYTTESGKRALEKHFKRIGEKAEVLLTENPNQYQIVYNDKNKQSARAENSFVTRFERIF